jgi:hypothetical protein
MTEGDTPDIWKFDGAAVAVDHTIAGTEIDGIANALGYLYFGYKSATAKAILGRLDSTNTYTDVHHNFSTFDTTFDWAEKVNLISFYRGGLVLGFSTTMILIVTKSAVGYSEGTDTAGAYTAIQPTLSTRFHLIQFGTF